MNYLLIERKWLRSGRPEEAMDQLDKWWWAMEEGPNWKYDQKFINERGGLINDDEENFQNIDHDSTKGNGYCFKWLDDFLAQELMMRQYQNG